MSRAEKSISALLKASKSTSEHVARVSEVVSAFRSLNVDDEDPAAISGCTPVLEKVGLNSADVNAVLGDLTNLGYQNLDFFAFCERCSVPGEVIAAARKDISVMSFSPSDFDLTGEVGLPESEQKHDSDRTFSESLIHQFPLVSRQVEAGLYSVKRVASFLKKICALEDTFSKESLKVTNHETGKLDKVQGDGMKRSINTWIAMQEIMFQHASLHQEFRTKVSSAVVLPLQAFHKEAENTRKNIINDMSGVTRRLKNVTDAVKKSKKKALEALLNLKVSQDKDKGVVSQAPAPQKKTGMFSKLSTKLKTKLAQTEGTDVLHKKAMAACTAFENALLDANTTRKQIRSSELPAIFDRMYQLEVARLDVLKDHLAKFALIFHELVAPMNRLSTRFVTSVEKMHTLSDVNTWIDTWVDVHGDPPAPQPFKYDLPTNADQLMRGQWNGSLELKPAVDSVFGSTLEFIMKLQEKKYPSEDLPVILTTLTKSVRDLGGLDAEGIFRISGNKADIDNLQKQIDSGNYDVKCTSPHVPSGLLKLWLRTLEEPLIPQDMYGACIEAAKLDGFSSNEALEIYARLPAITQRIVNYLADNLWVDIAKNKKVTLMGVNNIAIVFAPSFLRCESDDPLEMMQNSKFESRFTSNLVAGLLEKRGYTEGEGN